MMMFPSFFYLLRARGLKVSLNEWMSLMEALRLGLHGAQALGREPVGLKERQKLAHPLRTVDKGGAAPLFQKGGGGRDAV